LAQSLRLPEPLVGKIELAVTEAATNLLKHAGQGKIILRPVGRSMLELLAVDKGPGMADPDKCLRDGYSTAGTAGTGLGAISRLADLFDVYSQPGKGTVLLAQFDVPSKTIPSNSLVLGAVCVPLTEGDACGDDWSVIEHASRSQLLLADGIGHGVLAAEAAERAVEAFEKSPHRSPAGCVEAMHGPLRGTRGASLAVTEIDQMNGVVRYSGVGNIAGCILNGQTARSMVSHNGTVGHQMPRVQEFQYPWQPGSTLVLHSDGLLSRWKLDGYPGLLARHPSIIAAVLHRDFQRGRDDVTVLVGRSANRNGGSS
jgi:anti-sigma regulatory factor (Ser/Thr protein kinase)